MTTIHDEIRIAAPAAKIYDALTTQAGYRGWWNAVGEVDERAGGEARLLFQKDGTPVRMRYRIDRMTPGEGVRWTCVAHDMESWVGTTLTWQLRSGDGGVLVSFDHDGWSGDPPPPVVQGWKHFLGSLKTYVETGTGMPW